VLNITSKDWGWNTAFTLLLQQQENEDSAAIEAKRQPMVKGDRVSCSKVRLE